MKLGSLKEGGRDGTLVVVSRDLTRAVRATGIAPTLQRALEDWSNLAPRLAALSAALDDGSAGQGVEARRQVRPVFQRALQGRGDAGGAHGAGQIAGDDDERAVAAAFLE